MPVAPLVDSAMVIRRARVPAPDVVFVRGVLEASQGVAVLFAEHGGELTIASSHSRRTEMDQILADLQDEIPGFYVET